MEPWKRVTALFVLLTMAAGGGCDKPATAQNPSAARPATPPPIEVRVARSKVGPVERTIEVVGSLYGDEEATISAKVAGEIVSVSKDIGDLAAAGEKLAQIDPISYQLSRDQAKMALEQSLARLGLSALPGDDFDPQQVPTVVQKKLEADNLEKRFRRAEQVYTGMTGSISEQEYTDVRSAYEVAKAAYDVQVLQARADLAEARVRQSELRMRQQRLDDTVIRAPVPAATQPSSRIYAVTARYVNLGEYVREGTAAFRVVADDPIKLRATVPERYISQLKPDQRARLRVEGRSQVFEGTVTRVNPQIDLATRTFQIEAEFANTSHELRAGQFGRAEIVIGADQGVTFVPESAIVSFAGVVRVFTIADGKAVEHPVSVGVTRGDMVEITRGFSGEADVVVQGGSRLSNGVPVTVRPP